MRYTVNCLSIKYETIAYSDECKILYYYIINDKINKNNKPSKIDMKIQK